jgi:hypothetical protein
VTHEHRHTYTHTQTHTHTHTHTHAQNGIFWAINEILLFTSKWMELENIILSEVSQDHKDKGQKFKCLKMPMWKVLNNKIPQ